jgi:hypothetical protein
MTDFLYSTNLKKNELFCVDPYFRDCIDHMSITTNNVLDFKLLNIAPVIFRPDSIVTRECIRIFKKILALGYHPIYVKPFTYNRYTIRECWKYQLNIATRDRIDMMDMILLNYPCLYILFFTPSFPSGVSATQYLSQKKGPSSPNYRKENQLRYSVKSAQVSVLTFIHVADEPIDIIREWGAFFDNEERTNLFKALLHGKTCDAYTYLTSLADAYENNSLKYTDIIKKINDKCNSKQYPVERNIISRIEDKSLSWRAALATLYQNNTQLSHWDLVSICAPFAETHYSDKKPLIEDAL